MHVDRNKNRSASGVKQAARGNETAMDRIDLCVVKSFERFNNHPNNAGQRNHISDISKKQHRAAATAMLLKPGEGINSGKYINEILRRNNAISKCVWADQVDHLVFYEESGEGYVPAGHLDYIQNRSNLELTFVGVADVFIAGACTNEVLNSKVSNVDSGGGSEANDGLCPATPLSSAFRSGYKSMCWFWYSAFLQYVDAYELILRIDDDCFLMGAPPWPGRGLDSRSGSEGFGDNWVSRSPLVSVQDEVMDSMHVTRGMRAFFGHLAERLDAPPALLPRSDEESIRAISGSAAAHFPEEWDSPYTNVLLYNVALLRSDPRLAWVQRQVGISGCVFRNRWGDLPLWGATRELLGWPTRSLGSRFPYYHGSHWRKARVQCARASYNLYTIWMLTSPLAAFRCPAAGGGTASIRTWRTTG